MKCNVRNAKNAILVLMLLLCACTKDVYNPEKPVDPEKPVNEIPDDFEYATTKGTAITIEIEDRFQGKFDYQAHIYIGNPFSTKGGKLQETVIFHKKSMAVAVLELPTLVKKVYIVQVDPLQREVMMECDVTKETAFCSFKSPVTGSRSLAADLRAATAQSPSDYPLPESYIEIKQGTTPDFAEGKSYYIASGTNLSNGKLDAPWVKNVSLYVAGTVNLKNWNMPDGNKIVVLPGGKVDLALAGGAMSQSGCKLVVHGAAKGVAAGELNVSNHSQPNSYIQLDQNTELLNGGHFRAKQLRINNANVINSGTLELSQGGEVKFDNLSREAALMLSGNSSYFENNGTCTAPTFYAVKGSTLINSCHLAIGHKAYIDGTNVSLTHQSMWSCKDFKANISTMNLSGQAVLNIDNTGLFEYNNQITGVTESGATPIIAMKSYKGKSDEASAYLKGNLNMVLKKGKAVKDDDDDDDDDDDGDYTAEPGVKWSKGSLNAVAPSDCTGAGIEEEPGTGTPADPNYPIQVSTSKYYTFAMEDSWPSEGDYDMNDLVLGIRDFNYYKTKENKVESFVFSIDVKAVGATRKIGAGLQLDKIEASQVKSASVVSSIINDISYGNYFAPNGNGVEGSKYAVIPFFGNAHAALGVPESKPLNTSMGDVSYVGIVQYRIVFATPQAPELLNVNNLNFFIVNGGNATTRSEVHSSGHIPTEKVKGETNWYKTADNLMWGFMIPSEDFKHPLESVKIYEAYPTFADWCRSGGSSHSDWYLSPDMKKVYIPK